MTIYNEDGETRFSKLWVTKNGLSTEQPKPEDRMSHQDAVMMADEIMKLFGLDTP